VKCIPKEKYLDFKLLSDMEFGRQRVRDNRLGYNEYITYIKSKLK